MSVRPGVLIVVILVIAVAVAAAIYFLVIKPNEAGPINPAERALESATSGVLPNVGASPTEGLPNLNPAETGNPFKDTYKNPFQ